MNSQTQPYSHSNNGDKDLPAEMEELVKQINATIEKYKSLATTFTKQREDSLQRLSDDVSQKGATLNQRQANADTERGKNLADINQILQDLKTSDEWAIEHLRRQGVKAISAIASQSQQKSLPDGMTKARGLTKEGNECLKSMQVFVRPPNLLATSILIGLFGLIVSVVVASSSSPPSKLLNFAIVNILSLGFAIAHFYFRKGFLELRLSTQFQRWTQIASEANTFLAGGANFFNEEHTRETKRIANEHKELRQQSDVDRVAVEAEFKRQAQKLKEESRHTIAILRARVSQLYHDTGVAGLKWNDPRWSNWQPPADPSFVASLGALNVDQIETLRGHEDLDFRFSVPAMVPFAKGKEGRCLLFKCEGQAKEVATQSVQSLILRLTSTIPPGKVRFTFVDPVGLGQSASSFMQLADYDASLVGGKAWTEPQHIEQELLKLTEHMETVIQKYLRNNFDSIEKYNAKAIETAEPYRVLVVWDFPVNFTESAARRLVSIAENGPRCGVYTIVIMDTSAEKRLPYGFSPADLERASSVIQYDGDRFLWLDPAFKRHALVLDQPPGNEISQPIIATVGTMAKASLNVQVPYFKLLERANLNQATFWKQNTIDLIEAPLGPHGANEIQALRLGEKTAHHAIVVGRTGSGKSNLMHVIITSLALRYSPEEIELYLIDFKQGVEFKPYALMSLPHARVIAIESEREFGMSVLQGLDAELQRRGELFRTNNVNNIADYRKNVGQLPRILLLVDEFQEFFSQDDTIAAQARVILDRLVRQGRSQGIHVMLGSQSLKGSSDLPHSIISQMGVRIALQCTEADARQIMSDDNLVNRQLTRPGEAIYNAESGQVEANKLFQVALLSDKEQKQYLSIVSSLITDRVRTPLVFEGNEAARVENCGPLEISVNSQTDRRLNSVDAWLGEPIAIKPPVTARFRRQGASNLLVTTRDEQQGAGIVFACMLSLLAQFPVNDVELFVINMATADSEWYELPAAIKEKVPHKITLVKRQQLVAVLTLLTTEAERRANSEDTHAPEMFLIIIGLQRVRDLRDDQGVSSYFDREERDAPDPKALFAKIMRDGPEVGIHVAAWCDAYANVARIDRRLIGEFAMRVAGAMNQDDSQQVIDDTLASKLDRAHRAVFFDEERPGQLEKFRPYAIPQSEWLDWFAKRVVARNEIVRTAIGGV